MYHRFLACILIATLSLPAFAKDNDNASPDFVRLIASLSDSFWLKAGGEVTNRCEREAGSQAMGMLKGQFVMAAAQKTIFDPLAGTLKSLLSLLGLGPILDMADLTNAYINGGAKGFVRELAKIIGGKMTEAAWDKVRSGTNTSLSDFAAMDVTERLKLLEAYIRGQILGAGTNAAAEMVEDPDSFFNEKLGEDERKSWSTQFGEMAAVWQKGKGEIYINIVIKRKCPNPTDLKYGRVQIWGRVQAVMRNGKATYKVSLIKYDIKGVCCGEDLDTKYPPEETPDQKKARQEAADALKKAKEKLDGADSSSTSAGNAENGAKAQEAAAKANSEIEEAEKALREAEKKVKEAKKKGIDTAELERGLASAQRRLDEARKGAKSATAHANDRVLSEDEEAAKKCKKAIEDCEAEVAKLEKRLDEAKQAEKDLKAERDAVDKDAGTAKAEMDEVSDAEKEFKNCEAELKAMADEAGVETRQDSNGRTNIMGKVGDVDSGTWKKLVNKRKDCTEAYNKFKDLRKQQEEAEKKKAEADAKKADLDYKLGENKTLQDDVEKLIAAKKATCAKKRRACEKKRKALVSKYEDYSEADGVEREVPEHLQESFLKEEDKNSPGRRDRVRQAQASLTKFFTALEQENVSNLRDTLSDGFVTQDRLALAQARAVFLQSARQQFQNLNGTQYRVDVGPFRVDRSGKTAQVTLRWDQRARIQQTGQEWLVRDQETTIYFEEQDDELKLVVLQGDPFLRTNDFGITLVDEGTIDLQPVNTPFGIYSGSPVTQPEFLAGFPVNLTASGNAQPPAAVLTDLSLQPGSLLILPPNPQVGQAVNAQVVVQNRGAALSPPTSVSILLNGQMRGQQMIPPLQPNQSVPVMVALNGLAAGTFSTQARVDINNQVPESNEDNNSINGAPLAVTAPASVDLVAVPGSVQYNPPSPQVNQPIQVTFLAQNGGTAAAPATQASLTFNGALVANQMVPPLAPGQSSPVNFTVQAPPTPGNVVVRVSVDAANQVPEANEANNVVNGPSLVIQPGPPVGQPDLVITSFTVNGQPFPAIVNVNENVPFNLSIQVQNQGNAPSGATDAIVILVRGGGIPIGPVMVPPLNQGQGTSLNFQGVLPNAGPPSPTDAMLDPGNNVPESNEGNNNAPGPQIQVQP